MTGDEDERERLMQLFSTMQSDMVPMLVRSMEHGDLQIVQSAALHVLVRGEQPTVKELATTIGRSVSQTSRVVDQLVKRGFVERNEDPGDRRARRLRITEHPADQTVAVGGSVEFSVTARGSSPFSYQWIAVKANDVVDTIEGATSAVYSAVITNTIHDGASFHVVVSNSKGSVVSNSATLTVTGIAWPASATLTMGAQANATLGSAIDLDSGLVWLSAVANENQERIDLVYLYYNGQASLNGALAAKDSGDAYSIPLVANYVEANLSDIKMVRVDAKPLSQEHGRDAFETGVQLRSVVVADGDMFVVKTTAGAYAFVEVLEITGTSEGDVSLAISVTSLPVEEEEEEEE
jgi:DNA-binding MarR family transcriptional regulator